ncbi:hypothetical protein MRX96_041893 [Rhipicephalus microplus]
MRGLRFVNTPEANNTAFFQRLSQNIADNHTLAAMEFWGGLDADVAIDRLAVKQTVWRNDGFIPRAARIKQVSQYDRYFTGAVERVARYPALMDEVARRAKLERAELDALERDHLKETRSMDGFMRATGVVKERVICHLADDGRMQLDELNEDCWSLVRRYLVTDDVKADVAQFDSVLPEK